jgi:hypothetical protein
MKNAYFIGMGDYEDLAAAKERIILGGAKLHDSTRKTLCDIADEYIDDLANELSFMRGRIFGMLGGNHYFMYPSGITSDQKLCDKLGCEYLGCSAFIKLTIAYSSSKRRLAYDIWAHHGRGAARTPGGDINRVEQMREAMESDAYMMGHSHHRSIVPVEKLELVDHHNSKPYIRRKVQWLCRTGSFLNSYKDGEVSYIVDAAKNPLDQGCVILTLTLRREDTKDHDRCWIDSQGAYL